MRLFVTTMILVSNACGTAQRNQNDVLSPGQAGAQPSREIALHFFDAMTGKPLEGA